MGAITRAGKERMLRWTYRGETMPTYFYVMLLSAPPLYQNPPEFVSELWAWGCPEIATGNGYSSGGIQLARNTTNFDEVDMDTGVGGSIFRIYLRNIDLTASGGNIPPTGAIRGAVITTDEATVANRYVLYQFDIYKDVGMIIQNGTTGRIVGLSVGG